MLVAPGTDDRLHLSVAAAVVAGNLPPGAGSTAETGGELSAFTHLTFGGGDGADRAVFLQHPMGEHSIQVEVRVTGGVEALKVVQLPRLASKPGGDPGFDRAVIGAEEHMPRDCANGGA
jgi:hypothetical protein